MGVEVADSWGIGSSDFDFKIIDSTPSRFLKICRRDFKRKTQLFIHSFWRPKRSKKPWHEITRSFAEDDFYFSIVSRPDIAIALIGVTIAPLAQTEFLPVWYGFAMVFTGEGLLIAGSSLAVCWLFKIGLFYCDYFIPIYGVAMKGISIRNITKNISIDLRVYLA